jgi:hypothetical protein
MRAFYLQKAALKKLAPCAVKSRNEPEIAYFGIAPIMK